MKPYAATKQWKDGFGAGETRITAADLTRIEAGISAATQGVTNTETQINSLKEDVPKQIKAAMDPIDGKIRDSIPVGTVVQFVGSQAPQGWAFCNGQLLDRQAHSKLFSVLGTKYGSTSGANFRVPDMRGRFPVAAGDAYNVGDTGGASQVTLGANQIPAHKHDIRGKASTALANGVGMYASNVGGGSGWQVLSTTEVGSLSGLETSVIGGSQPHENRPPYFAVNFIIKIS